MRTFFAAMIPTFSVSVYGYCVFLFFSFNRNDGALEYPYFVALACAVASVLLNLGLARRERSIVTVSVANCALIFGAEFLCFSAPNTITGVGLHLMAGFVFFAPLLCGFIFCRKPIQANTMVIFCELSIVGTAFFMLIQLGSIGAVTQATILSIIALLLNLVLLSSLRVSASDRKAAVAARGLERGARLAVVFVVVFAVAFLAVIFLFPTFRNGLFAAAFATGEFLAFVAREIGAFCEFLFSLLPAFDSGEIELPPESVGIGADEREALGEMGRSIGYLPFVVAGGVLLAAFALILFRLRKRRLRRLGAVNAEVAEDDEGGVSPVAALRAFLARLADTLYFFYRLAFLRNTWEAVFIRVARKAGRVGEKRAPSETPREFLDRLRLSAPAPPEEDEDRLCAILDQIAKKVDERLYAPVSPAFERMPQSDVRVVARAFSKLSRH